MKGSYILVLQLEAATRLGVGKLGTFDFPAGWYLYCGSAFNGLESRVRRHLRQDKKYHWHIDFLTTAAAVSQVWWTEGAERRECSWAGTARDHPGATLPVPGFGSSDCRCDSHLVYLPTWTEVEALQSSLAITVPMGIFSPQRGDILFNSAS